MEDGDRRERREGQGGGNRRRSYGSDRNQNNSGGNRGSSGKGRGSKGGYEKSGNRGPRRDGNRTSDSGSRHDSDNDRRGPDSRKGRREAGPGRSRAPSKDTVPRDLTIPSDPQAILFKGIDCEVNGRDDLAMRLYLAGAARSSKGCENNALRMMRDMSDADLSSTAGRVAKDCDGDSNLVFDFLRLTLDEGADRSRLEAAADGGDNLAFYCLIRLGLVEGDDARIEAFASGMDDHPERVEEGLRLLSRRKDSEAAARLLDEATERRARRSSVRQTYVRASKGDRKSAERLDALAEEFPEAAFLKEHLETPAEGREAHLAEGMAAHGKLIVSMANELAGDGTAFGRYLRAKKLQSDGGEWIPAMVSAYRAGSEEALKELAPVRGRRDVKRQLSTVYLERGDVESLVRDYDGEDATYLDTWCAGDPSRVLEAGRLMGGSREIDWLKRGWLKGFDGCREAIVAMADDETRRSKQLVYTLHDVGADLEAAKTYFAMEGDMSLPSVKWLRKVCADDETREYVRSVYEERNDPATFEYIMTDDGYTQRSKGGKGQSKKDRGDSRKKGDRRRRRTALIASHFRLIRSALALKQSGQAGFSALTLHSLPQM